MAYVIVNVIVHSMRTTAQERTHRIWSVSVMARMWPQSNVTQGPATNGPVGSSGTNAMLCVVVAAGTGNIQLLIAYAIHVKCNVITEHANVQWMVDVPAWTRKRTFAIKRHVLNGVCDQHHCHVYRLIVTICNCRRLGSDE